jgi:hypothetical protein
MPDRLMRRNREEVDTVGTRHHYRIFALRWREVTWRDHPYFVALRVQSQQYVFSQEFSYAHFDRHPQLSGSAELHVRRTHANLYLTIGLTRVFEQPFG